MENGKTNLYLSFGHMTAWWKERQQMFFRTLDRHSIVGKLLPPRFLGEKTEAGRDLPTRGSPSIVALL